MKKINNIILSGLLLFTCILSFACNNETDATRVKNGDTVKVHYTGKLSDGTQFDTTDGREPIKFTLGANEVIPGFDKAVINMKIGENKTVTINAADAYGLYDNKLVYEVSRDNLDSDFVPQIGMALYSTDKDGKQITATITAVSDLYVTLDGNLPLAGKDLTFDIQLVDILPKTE